MNHPSTDPSITSATGATGDPAADTRPDRAANPAPAVPVGTALVSAAGGRPIGHGERNGFAWTHDRHPTGDVWLCAWCDEAFAHGAGVVRVRDRADPDWDGALHEHCWPQFRAVVVYRDDFATVTVIVRRDHPLRLDPDDPLRHLTASGLDAGDRAGVVVVDVAAGMTVEGYRAGTDLHHDPDPITWPAHQPPSRP